MLNKLTHKTLCVSCWTAYILQDDTRSYNIKLKYHYLLRNSPEERSSHLLCGGSLKSRMIPLCSFFCSHVLKIVVFEINGGVCGSADDDVDNYPNLFEIWRLICVE